MEAIMSQYPHHNSPVPNTPQPGQQQYPGAPMLPTEPKPKKRNWFARHKILTGIGIAIIVIALFSAMGRGGDAEPAADTAPAGNEVSSEEVTDAQPAEDASEPESEAEAAGPDAPGIGDAVQSGDLEFTVTALEAGGTEIGGDYLSETAQGEFLLVHVTVTNTGNEAATFFGSNQKLIDSEGREHETDSTASLYLPDNDTLFAEINPGNAVVGTLVFDLPANAEPVELVLQGGLFDEEVSVNVAGALS